jgi:RNA polymerase primary sigma factor
MIGNMTSTFDLFFEDIKNTRMLSAAEEISLSAELLSCECFRKKKISEKCAQCKRVIDTFVIHNLPLVVKIAQKYKGDQIGLQDLVGFGVCGLFTAAAKYDHTKNVRFASYAPYWIRDSILYALRTGSGVPSIPPYKITKVWKVSRAVRDLLQKGIEVTSENIAIDTNLSVDEVKALQQLLYQVISLDDAEFVFDQSSVEFEYIQKEREDLTQKELSRVLSDVQIEIIYNYYGFGNYTSCSLLKISQRMGVSLEYVRQLYQKALALLKESKLLYLLYEEL